MKLFSLQLRCQLQLLELLYSEHVMAVITPMSSKFRSCLIWYFTYAQLRPAALCSSCGTILPLLCHSVLLLTASDTDTELLLLQYSL
jgi:hypothetical protein